MKSRQTSGFFANQSDGLFAVGSLAHHFEIGFFHQELDNAIPEQRMVISDENRGLIHTVIHQCLVELQYPHRAQRKDCGDQKGE